MNKTIYKRWMAHILPYNKGYPIANNNWVRWIHNATGIFHCFDCLKLHNCWFSENYHPYCPLHENCHCHLESIPYSQVLVESKAMILIIADSTGFVESPIKERLYVSLALTSI